MSQNTDTPGNKSKTRPEPKRNYSEKLTAPEGYSSQEDDAPTRVITKRATYSQVRDGLPPLRRATTMERETEREIDNEKRKYPSYYVRDFGDKITPNFNDVQMQAGLTTTSTLAVTSSNSVVVSAVGSQITTMDVMHNWTQEVRDEEFVATINILETGSSNTAEREGRIVWVHVQDDLPSLERFEKIFKSHLASRVQQFVSETTVSLLNRVRIDRERKLVSGSLGRFLLPGITRYSARSSQTSSEDHPCLFANFPYFALGRFVRSPSADDSLGTYSSLNDTRITQDPNSTQDPEAQKFGNHNSKPTLPSVRGYGRLERTYHPTRTLLQSRYRLESTKKRDKNQAIFSLTAKQIRDCISRPSKTTGNAQHKPLVHTNSSQSLDAHSAAFTRFWPWRLRRKKGREKLYIPQLWSLSLSGDVMLTCGAISIEELCGSALVRKPFELGTSKLSHSLVRFIVENDDRTNEIFLYPAESCEWFFGLINKQRKVESHLGTQTQTQKTPDTTSPNPLHYSIVYKKQADDTGSIVECNNWLQIQSEHTGTNLDLYLEYDKSPAINVNGTAVCGSLRKETGVSHSHTRSFSGTAAATSPSSARFLLPPYGQLRGRSDSSSAGSVSSASINTPLWPERFDTFFEWQFLEEVTQSLNLVHTRSKKERVDVWLARVHKYTYSSHGKDIVEALQPTAGATVAFNQLKKLKDPIVGADLQEVSQKFFGPKGAAVNFGATSTIFKEMQRTFSNLKQLLMMFVPKEDIEGISGDYRSSGMILLYGGLLDRILESVMQKLLSESELKILCQQVQEFLDLAKQTHRGVWKLAGDKKDATNITAVNSAVIYAPLADALKHICDILFDILVYTEEQQTIANTDDTMILTKAIEVGAKKVRADFQKTHRFLISGGDENRYQKSLGPVVTPESIMILLLKRLSRGVYHDGTVNVIEVFERVVERLAIRVEQSASRFLLLEINRVAEEIDIILTNFRDQRDFFNLYRDYLDPNVIEHPTTKRKTRFEYEYHGIQRLLSEVDERIKDCLELKEHVRRLAHQNTQLVEGGQDDINKKLMLFTFSTILFLPSSVVAGFFGMNLHGVEDTEHDVSHFWIIAAPLTGGLLLIALLVLYGSKTLSILERIWVRVAADMLEDD